jgi:hypothetical protein
MNADRFNHNPNPSIVTRGDVVEFDGRFGKCRGVVVGGTFFAHCLGASSLRVYVREGEFGGGLSSRVCEIPLYGAAKIVDKAPNAATAAARVDAERAHCVDHLSQYPAWRENFARGVSVGF